MIWTAISWFVIGFALTMALLSASVGDWVDVYGFLCIAIIPLGRWHPILGIAGAGMLTGWLVMRAVIYFFWQRIGQNE